MAKMLSDVVEEVLKHLVDVGTGARRRFKEAHSIRGGGHIVAGAGRPTIRGGEKTAVSKLASTEGDKTAASPGIGSFLSFFKMGK